jgi:hypothetical protein
MCSSKSCTEKLLSSSPVDGIRNWSWTDLIMRLLVPTAPAPLSSIREPCPYLLQLGGLLVYSVRLV